ncbi:MAG TPA: HlyD family efflux transporter periplasmic adaptor subunit [Thermoanaerobaculia bacterium]|nr:HlyD family efflux transporter periplasmic adaptor subunit [Thermoanaerobaculia bacterium]
MIRLRYLIPFAIAVLFIGGAWTFRNQLAADRQGEWVNVSRGDLATGVDVTGTLASAEAGSFGPPQLADVWDYKIAMMAPEGTEVTTGQPILGFDVSELQKRLDEKSAEAEQARKEIEKRRADLRLKREDERLNLAEAQAKLRKTELKLETPSDIIGVKERKQVELDFALAKREVAQIGARIHDLESAAAAEIALLESKFQRASAIVAETKDSINKMTVRAPRAGTVVYSQNWRGEKKKVGDTCWKAERVMEIPDLKRMIAKGDVDEIDAGKVAVGQRVALRLDAHPDDEIRGTISSAATTVQLQQNTRDPLKVLKVEIRLDKSDPASMRPGMRFQGTVELARSKNAILVPREAVFVSPSGATAVRRSVLGVETVTLKVGKQNDKVVEVLGGLRDGDKVLIPKKADEKEKSS